jgi:hypothetical protein
MEAQMPGVIGLLSDYQRSLNECDARSLSQALHDEAWIIGFPADGARQFGGNERWFAEACDAGTSFDVAVSPPSGFLFENGYILTVQIRGEWRHSNIDSEEIWNVVTLFVSGREEGQLSILHSHSSPLNQR